MSLKRFCLHRGCNALVDNGTGYCELHVGDKKVASKRYDSNRPEWHELYNSDRWRKARIRYLQYNPLCVECEKQGRLRPATVVDHIKDHKGDLVLFWDVSNWQSMCTKHHNSKTARTNNKGINGSV